MLYFNPHLPCGRRLGRRKLPTVNCDISIHTFLAEGDAHQTESASTHRHFNPHLPCGRRLQIRYMAPLKPVFQSTPSLRKATREAYQRRSGWGISIHTFLAEGDAIRRKSFSGLSYFNPHLPCGRRRSLASREQVVMPISIHTFLAEGDKCRDHESYETEISIHTFLAEGDKTRMA